MLTRYNKHSHRRPISPLQLTLTLKAHFSPVPYCEYRSGPKQLHFGKKQISAKSYNATRERQPIQSGTKAVSSNKLQALPLHVLAKQLTERYRFLLTLFGRPITIR